MGFCRLADQKAKERGSEYDHIPDIVAGPAAAAALPVLKQIAVSLLFAATAYLLTPKPKELKAAAIQFKPLMSRDRQSLPSFLALTAFRPSDLRHNHPSCFHEKS